MTTPMFSPFEETGRLRDEICDRGIRHLVEADHHGEFVAIDVDPYAIADSVLAAEERLQTLCPGTKFDIWLGGLKPWHSTSVKS